MADVKLASEILALKITSAVKNKRIIRTDGICTIKPIKKPVNCVLVDDCAYGVVFDATVTECA